MLDSAELKEDLVANKNNIKGMTIIGSYRIANYFARQKGTFAWYLGLPILAIYRVLVEWILGIEIPAKTKIGGGLTVYHGQGLVINDGTVIGDSVILRHCTTIGNKIDANGNVSKCPIIGNNVEIGANAVIIGAITIGDNSKIGAGSVVVHDVPANSVAAGNPAKLITPRRAETALEDLC